MNRLLVPLSAILAACSCVAQDEFTYIDPLADHEPFDESTLSPIPAVTIPLHAETDRIQHSDESTDFTTPANQMTWGDEYRPAGLATEIADADGVKQDGWQNSAVTQRTELSAPESGGWLGQRFLRADIGFWKPPHDVDTDTSMLYVDFNTPAPWSDQIFTTISHDLFASFNAGAESYTLEKFGDGYSWQLRNQVRAFAFGTTLYVSTLRKSRPFVQLGYRYEDWGLLHTIEDSDSNRVEEVSLAEADRHAFVVNPGFEYDIHRIVAFRSQLDVNTREKFDWSEWHAQMILSPHELWILNIGGFGTMNGDVVGIRFGGGFRF